MPKRAGRKSKAQTPAPRKERIYGSKKNPKGSAASEKSASKIKLDDKTMTALKNKLKEFKEKHPNKKNITLNDLKAVYRRGAGAYSKSHRPTITGGAPNTRNAWSMARVNKFLLKAGGTKVKAAYVQDDDLMKMEDGGSTLLAPNGKPSNLSSEQWYLVRTPEFKAWFGDWENDPQNASKVVDENGEPLVVYRSVSPKPLAQGYNPPPGSWNYSREGYQYFAKNKDYSRLHGHITKEFFLNIRNILDFNYYNEILIANGIIGYGRSEGIFTISDELENEKPYLAQIGRVVNKLPELAKEIRSELKTADGFHGYEAGEYGEEESYVVRKPEQIKLADGTNTTFDPNLPDSRFAKGGQTFNDKELLAKWKRGESIGFTATAHLKAKGLIPRSDGTKRKSPKYKKEGGLVGGFEDLTDEWLSKKIEIFLNKVKPIKFYFVDPNTNTLTIGFDKYYSQDAAQKVYEEATSSKEFFHAPSVESTYDSKTGDLIFKIKLKKPVEYSKGGNIVYSAIFFDEDEIVKRYGQVHPNLYSHHSTIEFKPQSIGDLPIGDRVKISIVGRLTTDKVDVLLVNNPFSKNKHPHITLSTSEGVKPFESNKEIEQNINKVEPINDYLEGVVGYFDGSGDITKYDEGGEVDDYGYYDDNYHDYDPPSYSIVNKIVKGAIKLNEDERYILSGESKIDFHNQTQGKYEPGELVSNWDLKPKGLWYSLGDSWANYVFYSYPQRASEYCCLHKIEVSDKVLRLDTIEKCYEFTDKYGFTIHNPYFVNDPNIAWDRVALDYSGIEITKPHEWSRISDSRKLFWMYGWDVPSGCIWKEDGIKSIELLYSEYKKGGKIKSIADVDDIADYVPIFIDEDVPYIPEDPTELWDNIEDYLGIKIVKSLLKKSNIPIKVLGKVGEGFDGVAFKTDNGTILKVTKNGEEAMNSFLILKNYDNLEGQAKIYNLFIISNGTQKLYFIEKEKLRVAANEMRNFPLDYYDELWRVGQNEDEKDFQYWVKDLAKDWESENNQSVNSQEMKQAFHIVDLSHRIVKDMDVYDLEVNDATPHNVGYFDDDLYCFDCAASSDKILARGGNMKYAKGGEVDEKVIKERWAKKKDSLMNMADNIRSLRTNLRKDLKGDDDKDRLTALAISLMDKTAERVGNDESEANGHLGITGLSKRNVKVEGNTITLKYIGKSGVKHEKQFSDEGIATALKDAIANSQSKYVFETSDGFRIKNDRINRYLNEYDISAKDLRGYSANQWIVSKLREVKDKEILGDEAKRKKKFNEIVKSVAEKVGHGAPTLKKHYMLPSLEREWVNNGKIVDLANIKRAFEDGGEIDEYKQGGVTTIANIESSLQTFYINHKLNYPYDDMALVNKMLKSLGKDIKVVKYLGGGTNGGAYLTSDKKVLKISDNEQEAYSSFVIFKNPKDFTTQAKVHDLFVINNLTKKEIKEEKSSRGFVVVNFRAKHDKTYFILKDFVDVLSLDELEEDVAELGIRGYAWKYKFNEVVNKAIETIEDAYVEDVKMSKQEIEKLEAYLKPYYDFGKKLEIEGKKYGLEFGDSGGLNMGYDSNDNLICFDCLSESKYMLKKGGDVGVADINQGANVVNNIDYDPLDENQDIPNDGEGVFKKGGDTYSITIKEIKSKGKLTGINFYIGRKAKASISIKPLYDAIDYMLNRKDLRREFQYAKKEKFLSKENINNLSEDVLYVENLEVNPKYRGQGLSTLLLKSIFNYCKKNKIKYIYLYASAYDVWDKSLNDKQLKEFYKRHGFEEIGANTMVKKFNKGGTLLLYKQGGELKFNDIVLYHEKNGNWFVPKNTVYAWLYQDPNAAKKLESGEFEFVLFPPSASMPMAMRRDYVPPLLKIWTKKYQKETKGADNLLGIVKGWYDEQNKKLYIIMMTTRKDMRRKGVNSHIIKNLREEFKLDKDQIIFDKPTKEGEMFSKSGKYEDGGDIYLLDVNENIQYAKGGDVPTIEVEKLDKDSLLFDYDNKGHLILERLPYSSFNVGDYADKEGLIKELKKYGIDKGEKVWSIKIVKVKPRYRGQGVASTLLSAAIQWAKENKYEKLVLVVQAQVGGALSNEQLYELYSKFKFKPLKKTYGVNWMARKLDNGGEVDLFEHYDELPKKVQAILEKYENEEPDYTTLESLQGELEEQGYTFDYGLDYEPYNLRKMARGGENKLMDEYAFVDKDMAASKVAKKLQKTRSNEKANELEWKIYEYLQDWTGDSDAVSAYKLYKNKKIFQTLKKQYPKIFNAEKNKLVYRGLEKLNVDTLLELYDKFSLKDIKQIDFPDLVYYLYSKPIKYKPENDAQSWTTDIEVAKGFSEGVILVTKTDDNFIMNPEVTNKIGDLLEDEVIHLGKNYGKVYVMFFNFNELEQFAIEKSKIYDSKKLKSMLAKGGEIDDEEKKETYKKWKSLVNMSKSELEKFYNSEEGKVAGLTASQAKSQGIDSGRESARWIMKMKDTSVKNWTPTMWKWAKKQISFISRMSGNKGKLYDESGAKTRKHTSLLIWGHNPTKKAGGGEIDIPIKENAMNEVTYNQLPAINDLGVGKKFVLKEHYYNNHNGKPTHQGCRYLIVENMGDAQMSDCLKLKVHQCYGGGGVTTMGIITRPIKNIMNKGRDMGETLASGVEKAFKKGGELDPDKKEVKEYFEHKSGAAGGLLVGKRHSEGGIQAINKSTGQPLEMEGGEVVITRDAVSDSTLHDFNGKQMTNREILSAINESGGGVKFAEGGDVSCKCSGKEYKLGGKTYKDYELFKKINNSYGSKSAIEKGMKVEDKEHGETFKMLKNGEITYEQFLKKLVVDHLSENPKYYDK